MRKKRVTTRMSRGYHLLPLARKVPAIVPPVGGNAGVEQNEHLNERDACVHREPRERARPKHAFESGFGKALLGKPLELGEFASDERGTRHEDHPRPDAAAE